MSKKQSAVIFDWNGTIIDDVDACLIAANAALAFFGLPPTSLEKYREHYQVPLNGMYCALGCSMEKMKENEDAFVQTFFRNYEKAFVPLRLRKGVRRSLKALREDGVKTAVLSNYTIEKITAQAAQAEINAFFDTILANTNGAHVLNKGGKGDWLEDYFNKHNVERSILVGDTLEEIEIARRHGCVAVVLTGGSCSKERLEAAKPDFLLDSLEEFPEIARKVLGGAA